MVAKASFNGPSRNRLSNSSNARLIVTSTRISRSHTRCRRSSAGLSGRDSLLSGMASPWLGYAAFALSLAGAWQLKLHLAAQRLGLALPGFAIQAPLLRSAARFGGPARLTDLYCFLNQVF